MRARSQGKWRARAPGRHGLPTNSKAPSKISKAAGDDQGQYQLKELHDLGHFQKGLQGSIISVHCGGAPEGALTLCQRLAAIHQQGNTTSVRTNQIKS